MARVSMPLFDDAVPVGYGNIGHDIDLTAYRSCVLYFKVTGLTGGTFSVGLYEIDEITNSSINVAGATFTSGTEGYLRAPIDVLYGNKYQLEWYSPGSDASVVAGIVALD